MVEIHSGKGGAEDGRVRSRPSRLRDLPCLLPGCRCRQRYLSSKIRGSVEVRSSKEERRVREERSIDVPEEMAEVVVGGSKLYGALRRDGLMFYRVDLINFVCSGSRCV